MGKPQKAARDDERFEELHRRVTFEDLARAQGVRPAERLEDFTGGWPEDQLDDGFEAAVVAWRLHDISGEPG